MKIVIIKKWWLKQKYHFRIVARNGKILASSEGYYNQDDCVDAAESIQKEIPNAIIHFKCAEQL
jgi:uncharacterized protein YegP (UPF0339 family)